MSTDAGGKPRLLISTTAAVGTLFGVKGGLRKLVQNADRKFGTTNGHELKRVIRVYSRQFLVMSTTAVVETLFG